MNSCRAVLPHAGNAWFVPENVNTGDEIRFAGYFYKPKPLRSLEEIRAGILALERERRIYVSLCLRPRNQIR